MEENYENLLPADLPLKNDWRNFSEQKENDERRNFKTLEGRKKQQKE